MKYPTIYATPLTKPHNANILVTKPFLFYFSQAILTMTALRYTNIETGNPIVKDPFTLEVEQLEVHTFDICVCRYIQTHYKCNQPKKNEAVWKIIPIVNPRVIYFLILYSYSSSSSAIYLFVSVLFYFYLKIAKI